MYLNDFVLQHLIRLQTVTLDGGVSDTNINSLHDILQTQRRRTRLLAKLTEVALAMTSDFQAEGHRLIFRHGIENLPDATLSRICVIIYAGTISERALALERFQLVCRRFRKIALGVAQLWSFFDDRMSPERMVLQSSRCGNVAASFNIRRRYTLPPLMVCRCERWNALVRSVSRWSSGVVDLWGVASMELQHECLTVFEGWQLPYLTTLNMRIIDDDFTRNIISSWEIPQLERLVCNSTRGFSPPLTRPLKALELSIIDLFYREWFSDASQFLTRPNITSIEHLSLMIVLPSFSHEAFWRADAAPIIALDRLEELTVTTQIDTVPSQIFTVLQMLQMPNIKRIDIRTHVAVFMDSAFFSWLDATANSHLETVSAAIFNAPTEFLDDIKAQILFCLSGSSKMDNDAQRRLRVIVTERKITLSPLIVASPIIARSCIWPVEEQDSWRNAISSCKRPESDYVL